MGRIRRSQRQSARVYYEGHDHREIILNGEYINAVYVPSEHTYMDKDVAWRKYKKLTLYGFAQYDDRQFVSVDVFNKFISFSPPDSAGSEGAYLLGSDFVVWGGYLSKNGYDFKYIDSEGSPSASFGEYRYAKQYPVEYMYDSSTLIHTIRYTGYQWRSGEQYAQVIPIGTKTMTDSERKSNLRPCGEARDGLFANRTWTERVGTQYPYTYHHYIEVYHINSNGFNLVYSDDYISTERGISRLYPDRILSHGNQYCGVTSWRNNDSQGVRLWISEDGNNWQYYDLFNETPWALRPTQVTVVYRANKWYFYVQMLLSSQWKWILYTATDLTDRRTYQQVALPDYIDIPMLGYDNGIHGDIDDCDGEYVRIIINNYDGTIPAEQGDTTYMGLNAGYFTMPSYDYRFFSINDGHMNYDPPNTFMYGYDTDVFEDFYVSYYVDNMTFQPSSNNFAFKRYAPDNPWSQENHEIVADDDYVWGNNNNA